MASRRIDGRYGGAAPGADRWSKLAVVIGLVGFLGAILLAHESPADGYEVSIYRSTPVGVWIGFAVAYLMAAIATVTASDRRVGGLGISVGGLTTVGIMTLPALRGYRYHGHADALTHLGWVRDMAAGRMEFFELMYPGSHSSTILLSDATGLADTHVVLFLFGCLVGVYVLFVPLTVRALVESHRATAIAAFSGFLLLPIAQVTGRSYYHTFTFTTLLVPLVVFLLVKHLNGSMDDERIPTFLSPGNVVLALAGVAMVLFHPQTTLNVVILLVVIATVQFIYRRLWPDTSISGLRAIYGIAITFVAVWAIWIVQFDAVFWVGQRVLTATEMALAGQSGAGGTVESQGSSAASIGVSIYELFFKLFFVAALYCLFAVGLFVAALRSDRLEPTFRGIMLCFGFAGFVLVPFFVAHFLGNISHLFFRHVAFVMALATIFGAIGIHYLVEVLELRVPRIRSAPVAVSLLSIALVLSVLIAFPSPYIYNQGHHVSDYQMDGYETAIQYHDDTVEFTGVRVPPSRYFDALTGENRPSTAATLTEAEILNNPSTARENDLYLPITTIDRDREVTAYGGLRYSRTTFETIDEQPDVHRIQSNDEFTLYYVEGNAVGPPEGQTQASTG